MGVQVKERRRVIVRFAGDSGMACRSSASRHTACVRVRHRLRGPLRARRLHAADRQGRAAFNRIPLEHGEPIRFGPDGEHGVIRAPDGRLVVGGADDPAVVVHDAHRDDPTRAFALAGLAASPSDPTPIGVFRAVDRPVGIAEAGAKLADARGSLEPGALDQLLHAGDTWTVA